MPNQAPAHWSKDFVEHLRTVHFTLIALCVGLIVLASFPSKTEIQIAHEQASQILEVTNTWNENFIETMAATAIRAKFKNEPERFVLAVGAPQDAKVDLILGSNDFAESLRFVSPSWIIDAVIPPEALRRAASFNGPEFLVLAPSSLLSFQRLWDALQAKGSVVVPVMPKECFAGGFFLNVNSNLNDTSQFESVQCALAPHNTARKAGGQLLRLRRSSEERYRQLTRPSQTKWEYEFSGSLPAFAIKARGRGVIAVNGEVVLPVPSITKIEFDGQKALIQRFQMWEEKDGRSFKDAFRELATVCQPFETADISSAERILDAEAKRSGDAFEAAGLKIPADIAVRCGVLLILAVQFYILIHLREFGNRLDRQAGFEVAWIGVYTSELARGMLFVSLLVLPLATVCVLDIRGFAITEERWRAWTILVASLYACFALSYLIFRALPEPPTPALPVVADQTPANPEQPESVAPVEQHFE